MQLLPTPMEIDPKKYDQFVEHSPQGTVFCTRWWLDATARNQWSLIANLKEGEIQAAWPIVRRPSRLFSPAIVMPVLTPCLGPLFRQNDNAKFATKLSYQRKNLLQLIEKLPKFSSFLVRCHYTYRYWLPFYWKGFNQTTRYTYVITDLSDTEAVWKSLPIKTRNEIKGAQNNGIDVQETDDLEEFWKLHRMTLSRKSIETPYSFDTVQKIDQACSKRGQRKIFVARNNQGHSCAGAYIIWDHRSAYYLMGGIDSERKESNATSALLWKAILFSSSVAKRFDFEGSMIQSIESFFRSFGGEPMEYYSISKPAPTSLKIMQKIGTFLHPG